jgi:hypothetical protein
MTQVAVSEKIRKNAAKTAQTGIKAALPPSLGI